MACASPPLEAGFVGGLLNYADCQAQAIGAGGYQALAAPGSTLSLTLTALLTLFVALFGYRMLFGQVPTVRDGVLALVKIGIVMALATGWAAYRPLIYDVAFKAPAELTAEIGAPAALPGAGGGLAPRLDNADRLLLILTEWGSGQQAAPESAASARPPYLTPGPATGVPIPGSQAGAQPGSSFDSLAFGGARVLFLTGAAGALGILRLLAGVLLAIGPFFLAFLLFDATRGLFVGWLRVLGGAALGALGAAIVLGVQLALIEPWIVNRIALRAAGYAVPGAAVELLVIMLIFTLALLAMLVALARVTYALRLPAAWPALPLPWFQNQGADRPLSGPRVSGAAGVAPGAERSRAAAIADAVAATQRREGPAAAAFTAPRYSSPDGSHSRTSATPVAGRTVSGQDMRAPPPPLGQSYRRVRNRTSLGAARRDRTS